jgi:hypothetical protein
LDKQPVLLDIVAVRKKRTFWLGLGLLLAGVATAGAVLYYRASRVPANYAPAVLSEAQREQAAQDFYNRIVDFGNAAQYERPFTWSLDEQRVNWYLASMDEIAAQTPNGQPGRVNKAIAQAGFDRPAVRMADGVLTLMVRSSEYDKVLSVDLSPASQADGKLAVKLLAVRVGELTVPDSLVRGQLDQLRKLLDQPADRGGKGGSSDGVGSDDLGRLLAAILGTIDSEPIEPEITWPVNHKRVRIGQVDIRQGKLTLHVSPSE